MLLASAVPEMTKALSEVVPSAAPVSSLTPVMAGAAGVGLDALFIASGLHLAEAGSEGTADAEAVVELFSGTANRPVAAQSRLNW